MVLAGTVSTVVIVTDPQSDPGTRRALFYRIRSSPRTCSSGLMSPIGERARRWPAGPARAPVPEKRLGHEAQAPVRS